MAPVYSASEREFLSHFFSGDRNPFDARDWYRLGPEWEYISGLRRREQIGWQCALGLKFLQGAKRYDGTLEVEPVMRTLEDISWEYRPSRSFEPAMA